MPSLCTSDHSRQKKNFPGWLNKKKSSRNHHAGCLQCEASCMKTHDIIYKDDAAHFLAALLWVPSVLSSAVVPSATWPHVPLLFRSRKLQPAPLESRARASVLPFVFCFCCVSCLSHQVRGSLLQAQHTTPRIWRVWASSAQALKTTERPLLTHSTTDSKCKSVCTSTNKEIKWWGH